MGLFSRKKEISGSKILTMDLKALRIELERLGQELSDRRTDPTSQVFVAYITKLLNKEILELSTAKELNGEAYAYRRGRVQVLQDLLNTRQIFISRKEHATPKDSKNRPDPQAKKKRAYMTRSRRGSAGMSD